MRKLNVLIAGSTGYIGIQLIKLLVKHKNINIKYFIPFLISLFNERGMKHNIYNAYANRKPGELVSHNKIPSVKNINNGEFMF